MNLILQEQGKTRETLKVGKTLERGRGVYYMEGGAHEGM